METHLQKQAVRGQRLQWHRVFVESQPRPHSESGKVVSSKCDSVRESSEIHHRSLEAPTRSTGGHVSSLHLDLRPSSQRKGGGENPLKLELKSNKEIYSKDATQIHSDHFFRSFQ